ncbi:hypothetical protein V6N11_066023 [Hibiscus sabdariffa]|uniref:Uncharacterized protein n=2 Tax=Hibiscus sabdariffa TaxID=183260 RepID=A0ABR2ARQ4_9ROSI
MATLQSLALASPVSRSFLNQPRSLSGITLFLNLFHNAEYHLGLLTGARIRYSMGNLYWWLGHCYRQRHGTLRNVDEL